MKTRWQDVLDVQLEINAFLTSEFGRAWSAGWFLANYEDPAYQARWLQRFNGGISTSRVAIQEGAAWAIRTGVQAFNAEPIYVDDDMMGLVEAAIAGFHGEPLVETDLITPNGLLVLPRPLTMHPTREGLLDLSWSVAQWTTRTTGLSITLYHDTTQKDALDLHDPSGSAFLRMKTRYLPTHTANWPFGTMHPGFDERMGHDDAQVQLQAIWRLLNQTLAIRTRERAPRQFLRRALKAKLPNEHVTVVRLRRPSSEHERDEATFVNWTHRWVVGGHWRNQWYASINLHRQIWISPYVKGPEELPLIVNKARIFALVR